MTETILPSFLVILLAAALPTAVCRWAGVFAAGYLREDSPWFDWVRAVATALIAAVIAKLLVFPTGALADLPLLIRVGSVAIGALAFLVSRRSILAAVATAEVALLLSAYLTL
ncbi:MAG: AzlD domain-containing protein [Pseudomonadota bacterium]